jgi:hypothetical protein
MTQGKRGRPPADNPRCVRVELLLTADEWLQLAAVAAERRRSVAQLLRGWALVELEREGWRDE